MTNRHFPRDAGNAFVREHNNHNKTLRPWKNGRTVLPIRPTARPGGVLCAFYRTAVSIRVKTGRGSRLLLLPYIRGPPPWFSPDPSAVADIVKKFLIGRAFFAFSAYLESEGREKVLSTLAQESVLVSDCHDAVASRRAWIPPKESKKAVNQFEGVLEKRLCAQQKERKHSLSVCNGSCGDHLGGLHTGEPRQDRGGFSGSQGDLGWNLP